MMSSCCTLRLNRRNAFSRDSPSCNRTSAKLTHPQTRPVGPDSYYKDLTLSQEEMAEFFFQPNAFHGLRLADYAFVRPARRLVSVRTGSALGRRPHWAS